MRATRLEPQSVDARLRLLGGFDLSVGDRTVSLPVNARRLVALLALRGATPRTTAAGVLWPDVDDAAVLGRLRTTVWRANAGLPGIVVARDRMLLLAPWIAVDVHTLVTRSSQILSDRNGRRDDVDERDVAGLAARELLPEWSDDWVVEEREYVRQIQLHALEALAAVLVEKRSYSAALESAMRAVRIDPMRETAHRAVIAVHLAERNVAEAARHYRMLQGLLERELGVAPSPDLDALLADAVGDRARRVHA